MWTKLWILTLSKKKIRLIKMIQELLLLKHNYKQERQLSKKLKMMINPRKKNWMLQLKAKTSLHCLLKKKVIVIKRDWQVNYHLLFYHLTRDNPNRLLARLWVTQRRKKSQMTQRRMNEFKRVILYLKNEKRKNIF